MTCMIQIINKTGIGNDTEVYSENGLDLIPILGISNIEICINAKELLTAKLTCYVSKLELAELEAHVMKKIDYEGNKCEQENPKYIFHRTHNYEQMYKNGFKRIN